MLARFFRASAVALTLFFVLGSSVALAQTAPAATETELADVFPLDSIEDGPHFFADKQLLLDDVYMGSVYAAGGEVRFTGTVDGDLVVMGGSVVIDGSVTEDVYAAGGTVTVTGDIGGTLTVAGGTVTIPAGGEIVGSLVGAARTYTQEGDVFGDVMLGAKDVILAGTVGQSMRLEADRLQVDDTAVVGENLQAEVRRESSVSENAQIVGEDQVVVSKQTKREKKVSPVGWSTNWIVGLVGRIIVMSVGLLVFGDFIKRAANIFDRRWPEALWKGAAFTVVIPFVILTLMLTIIGLPAALLGGLLYLLVMLTAWVVPGYWLGRLLVPKVSQYAQGAVGAAIVSLVTFVPVFGWVIRLLLAVLGAGALLSLWKRSK